jgi:hypothetical protein
VARYKNASRCEVSRNESLLASMTELALYVLKVDLLVHLGHGPDLVGDRFPLWVVHLVHLCVGHDATFSPVVRKVHATLFTWNVLVLWVAVGEHAMLLLLGRRGGGTGGRGGSEGFGRIAEESGVCCCGHFSPRGLENGENSECLLRVKARSFHTEDFPNTDPDPETDTHAAPSLVPKSSPVKHTAMATACGFAVRFVLPLGALPS